MSTKPRYSYAPLASPRHTRLVILHSSETDNYPINCEIVEVNIDEGPIYEALSYTWNNEVPSKPLEIISADGSDTRSLLITTNCARALRLLRKRIKRRATAKIGLWVDAVCINQSRNEEKSAQVSMMAEIYRNARNVVVWLGSSHAPPNRRSMLPLQLSRPFSLFHEYPRSLTRKGRWINNMTSITKPVVKRIIETGGSRALQLFDAPYWTRAWTLQEYPHLSTQILCLNSGYYSILGSGLSPDVLDDATELVLHYQLVEMNRNQELSLFRSRLLSMSLPVVIGMKCSDPRDKVFALRELFLSVFGGVAVDYSRPVEDIFTEATRCLILASQNLEALYTSCSYRKFYNAFSAQEEPYNLPSWAIDWTGASEGGLYHFSEGQLREEESWYPISLCVGGAYHGPDLPAQFSDHGLLLKIFGKNFSQVSKCVSDRLVYHPEARGGGRNFLSVVRRFLTEATEKQFTTNAHLGCAMAKLLRTAIVSDWENITKAEDQMEAESDVDRICELIREGCRIYSLLLRRRRLFVTTDGRIGIGNSNLVPGDMICTFAGLNMPFIVREKGVYHELISPAIVDGAMHLEMWPDDESEIVPWVIV